MREKIDLKMPVIGILRGVEESFFGEIMAASFAANLVLLELIPKAAFYLLPARAWELGFGGILAGGGQWEMKGRPRIRPGDRILFL